MQSVARALLMCGVLSIGTAAQARADILFFFHLPGSLQPAENLLFNDPSLTLTGTTVQGLTNQTALLVDISGQESLIGDGGQASVSGADGTFTWLNITPHDTATLFGEFEANLAVYKTSGPTPTGTVTVSVTNNFGAIETSSYDVGAGQNYFSLLALDPQLIQSVLITSTVPLAQIEQIRLGDVQQAPPELTTVPEPGSLVLFGAGLIALGRRVRRRVN